MSNLTGEVRVPGKRPSKICGARTHKRCCNRPQGHTGRHAFIWWGMGGIVRTVWAD